LGFHRHGGLLLDQNECAYIAKLFFTLHIFFAYPCFESHDFRLCGTPVTLLDKDLLTPHILEAGNARFVLIILYRNFQTQLY